MLMRTDGLNADQLLTDLLATRERLARQWAKGTFHDRFDGVCIMAAANIVTEQPVAQFNRVPAEGRSAEQERLGRIVFALYTTLYGPEAPTDIPVSKAAATIAKFNDDKRVSKEAVLLLFDRAIQSVLTPATVAS